MVDPRRFLYRQDRPLCRSSSMGSDAGPTNAVKHGAASSVAVLS